jgi:hypothetical protein
VSIDDNQKVGIGTTSPDEFLDIEGDADVYAKIQYTGNGSNTPADHAGLILSHGRSTWYLRNKYSAGSGVVGSFSITEGGANALVILASTNNHVGIGTDYPSKKLHVKESSTATYAAYIENSVAGGDYLAMVGDAGDNVFEFDSGGTGGEAQMKMYSDGVLKNLLDANGSSYFTGNIGIGVTGPVEKLEVDGTIKGNKYTFDGNASNPTTTAASIYDQSGVGLTLSAHNISFRNYDGANMAESVRFTEDSTRITNKLGVGSTTAPVVPLDVTGSDTGSAFNDGIARFANTTGVSSGGATVINIRNNYQGGFGTLIKFFRTSTSSSIANISFNTGGTAVNYNTGSDYRLKEDLKTFNGLDIIDNISVYNYKWKGVDFRGHGVLAHELASVFPDAVTGEKDAEEMQSVDYSKLVPVLIKSVQELKKEIELLKQQLNK